MIDHDHLPTEPHAPPAMAPAEFWEERYTSTEQVWSGRVNHVLADVASLLVPGRALDLGCGEGADAIWLAESGWTTLGIDIAPAAIGRATGTAEAAGLPPERVRFLAGDLSDLPGTDQYELVTASFLHSPVDLPRVEILRRAAELVVPGGHLLITSHGAAPPWADAAADGHRFNSASEELEELGLDPAMWRTVLAEIRTRTATGPDGQFAELEDVVVLLRRR